MPNLYYLKLESEYIHIDGHQWEKVIRKYLSKLRVFKFRLKFSLSNDIDEIRLDEVIDTYRTKFWIDEHQWFVQCHCRPFISYQAFHIFSLPFTFHQYPINANGILVKINMAT